MELKDVDMTPVELPVGISNGDDATVSKPAAANAKVNELLKRAN